MEPRRDLRLIPFRSALAKANVALFMILLWHPAHRLVAHWFEYPLFVGLTIMGFGDLLFGLLASDFALRKRVHGDYSPS